MGHYSTFQRIARDDYDPTGKILLTSDDFEVAKCLPPERLNLVYNAADVGSILHWRGLGLVNFEHAATGTAQVVPDHTSLQEIFFGIPRIDIESWEVDRNYLDRGVPSPVTWRTS